MDPETQRLTGLPRSLGSDAFFFADRSTTTVTRAVSRIEVQGQGRETQLEYEKAVVDGQRDRPGVAAVTETFTVFTNKHAVSGTATPNPLPHARKVNPSDAGIDPALRGWTHDANYTAFFNAAARALSGNDGEPRLQVRLLFGTGSEFYRHGVCGALETSPVPILLIVISGVEPGHSIVFYDPTDLTGQRRTPQPLPANNRWGVGITTAAIENIIVQRYSGLIAYDLSVCSAFSTGYLGLKGSINGSLFSVTQLNRVVIFDCLYAELKSALDRVKSARPSVHIVAYVVTSGGNSFQPNATPSLATLVLGGNQAWNYVDLIGNVGFHAITSARLVSEARRSDARILDPLLSAHEAALNGLVGVLPARNTVVSSETLIRKVKGPVPSGTTSLATFASDKTNASLIRNFFAQIGATRRCIGRARLLGWPTPPGEEWHDMLLIEFAWEYLT